jgi:hypothetical protein
MGLGKIRDDQIEESAIAKWYEGAGTPGAIGQNDDFYLNRSNGDVYEKISGTWTFKCNIKGPQGETGATGTTGATGATGATGPGVATGGQTGQVLKKKSATNYDTEWGALSVPGCRIYNSTNQSLNNNTEVTLAFNSEVYDNDNMHDTVTNNSRIYIQTSGKYLIIGLGNWAQNTTGDREIQIRRNGSNISKDSRRVCSNGWLCQSVCTLYDLSAGDYLEMVAYQNSGNALSIWNGNQTSLMVSRVSD